jgi:predicted nucleotidyltransferase
MMDKNQILYILKSQKDYLQQRYGIEVIGVFGSVARGENNDNSDVDILYKFKDKKLSLFEYMQLLNELEEKFNTKVDLVREDKIKPFLKEYIQKDIVNV